MTALKCPNCRLSLPQNWAGMNDANAKCPYCGKPLAAGKAASTTQTGTPEPPPPAPPAPQQPAGRPAGAAKTILWGVGVPIPGVPIKPAPEPVPSAEPRGSTQPIGTSGGVPAQKPYEPPAKVAAEPVNRPAFAQAVEDMSTAATANRTVAGLPQGADQNVRPGQDASAVDVDISDSVDSGPSRPGPAPTVMFNQESHGALAAALPSSADSEPPASEPPAEEEPSAEESGPQRTKSKAKGRPVSKKGQRRPGQQKWGSMGGDVEEDAAPASSSSKKGIVIAVVAAVVVIVVIVAALALRSGKKTEETSAQEASKTAEPEQAKAEPSAGEQPSGLAAKPAAQPAKPAEATKPAVAEKPASNEKPAKVEKTVAARPSQPERAERPARPVPEAKAQPDKGKPVASSAGPAPTEPKPGANKPTETDYQRANDAYQRGNTKLFKGDTPGAIIDFNLALKLNPRDPAIHRGLGLAYAQAGNSADAAKHLKAYLKEAPRANDRATIEKRIEQLRGK
jgi:hypothetical protein